MDLDRRQFVVGLAAATASASPLSRLADIANTGIVEPLPIEAMDPDDLMMIPCSGLGRVKCGPPVPVRQLPLGTPLLFYQLVADRPRAGQDGLPKQAHS